MTFKLKSQGSSFKMMGSSPVKIWGKVGSEIGKKVIKEGVKKKAKKSIKSKVIKGLVAGERTYSTGEDYNAKKKTEYYKDKSGGRTLADAVWDNTAGFAGDLVDVLGESTGWFKPVSMKYPWGDGSRKNWSEEGWAEENVTYDSRTNRYLDDETGHWHNADTQEIEVYNPNYEPPFVRPTIEELPDQSPRSLIKPSNKA